MRSLAQRISTLLDRKDEIDALAKSFMVYLSQGRQPFDTFYEDKVLPFWANPSTDEVWGIVDDRVLGKQDQALLDVLLWGYAEQFSDKCEEDLETVHEYADLIYRHLKNLIP